MTKLQTIMIAVLCALTSVLAPVPAHAAHDTQPPVLSTPIKARFIAGTQISQFRDQEEGHAYYDVPMRLSWSATDNVDKQLNYDVWEHPVGSEPNRIGNFITTRAFNVSGSDYDGFFGGAPLVIDNWSVQAYDNADNSTERSIYGAHLLVTQDNGNQTFGSESTNVSLRYVGAWTSATCACFADETTRRTNVKNAAAVVRVVVPRAQDLRRVALVFDTAPLRGRAQIFVDGKLVNTVDTRAAVIRHRVVLWSRTLGPGIHRIRVVNLATPGRARIDLDAVVTN